MEYFTTTRIFSLHLRFYTRGQTVFGHKDEDTHLQIQTGLHLLI